MMVYTSDTVNQKQEQPFSPVSDTVKINDLKVKAFKIPTDSEEGDGTYSWNSTTMILVEITAGDNTGTGFTYGDLSTAVLIHENFRNLVRHKNIFEIPSIIETLYSAVRNSGRPGIASVAISAVDFALWDLKCRILEIPLMAAIGQRVNTIPVYGSGGFTNYSDRRLEKQLKAWVDQGIKMVKMKINANLDESISRIKSARKTIGDAVQLFVDANGAYSRKQALKAAEAFSDFEVSWFEEPVSSDDTEGLKLIRDRAPSGMEITAGEYGYDVYYFSNMLQNNCVDIIQADATRCGGITGYSKVAVLAEAFSVPISAHTAPSMHIDLCCSVSKQLHLEYFYDHIRIEQMLFENIPKLENGALIPNTTRPGNGLIFKEKDAEKFKIS